MEINDRHYCDFCNQELRFDDYQDVRMPVLYSEVPDKVLCMTFNNADDALDQLERETNPTELGFYPLDLCKECMKKMVNVCVVNVPAKDPIYGRDLSLHRGNRIALFKEDLPNVREKVKKVMEEQAQHNCESCLFHSKVEHQLEGCEYFENFVFEKCLYSGKDLKQSYAFFSDAGIGCPHWRYNNHLGYSQTNDKDHNCMTVTIV